MPDHHVPAPGRHTVFQTSIMSALLDGVYDGEMTIGELLEHGDFGLGTFNALDGELLILDGQAHQLRDGRAEPADPALMTPFAVVTHFVPRMTVELPRDIERADVGAAVADLVGSDNYLAAMRITGDFHWVRTRTAGRQSKPYPPLREATDGEPVHAWDDISGTLGGFRTPLYEQGIGVPGRHVHFIDDSRSRGGHILDYRVRRATLEVCLATDLHLALPLTEAFRGADLHPADLAEQIEATENHT
ncbi:acetolactate decarboxylase [Nakamurella flavida]|uniref:acetolactate decarboxylase n=1 Tax=Nakamurella flavida TaxID=363630 RepID=UPI002788EACC|nr:acetolactate decarboxylase [Nakamurella flavida]MDP9777607.1 acetolactate decarboxylase [Nakamurella flavida]